MKNTFDLVFENRDFTARLDRAGLKFQVNSYSFKAIGGCAEASISATGGELGLWDLINWLRCPVKIYDGGGTLLWWGYVHQVQVRQDALEIAASLDSMVNRVAVAYSYVEPGTATVGARKTTAWADNLDSQAEFGIKEFLSSASGLSDAAAEGRRAAILAAQSWPQGGVSAQNIGGVPRGRVRYSGARKSLSATLTCRGWWETLNWKYASVGLTSGISNAAGANDYNVDDSSDALMQQITPIQTINIHSISVKLKKTGSPADNLRVRIFATNSSGNPTGSALSTATIAASGVTSTYDVYTATLSPEINLTRGVIYAIQLDRSGSTDASNYVTVQVDQALGYSGGVMRVSTNSGSTWVSRSPNADLYFTLYQDNQVDSTLQIADLVTDFGQFFTATDLEALSGLLLSSYQDGDNTALSVVEGLLAAGGANGRRLLASVDPNRRVQIWEEPAVTGLSYTLDSQAQLHGTGGILVNENQPPVGVWCRLTDVLPGVVDLTKLVDPSLQFIEGSGWSAGSGATYSFRGQPSIESLLEVGG